MSNKNVAIIGRAAMDIQCLVMAKELAITAAKEGYNIITSDCGPISNIIRESMSGELEHKLVEIPVDYKKKVASGILSINDNSGLLKNYFLVTSADYIIAIGGGPSTLCGIAMAWKLCKPICIMGPGRGWALVFSWWLDHQNNKKIIRANNATEAIKWLRKAKTHKNKNKTATADKQSTSVKSFFDEHAEWEKSSAKNLEDLRVVLPRTLLEEVLNSGGTAIDIGGGAGFDTVSMAKAGMKVYYIEISSKLAKICHEQVKHAKLEDLVTFFVESWETAFNRIPDESCDLIIAMGESISFIIQPSDRKNLFLQLKKKVRKGGHILLTVDNLYGRIAGHLTNGDVQRATSLLGSQLDEEVSNDFPVYCYTREELENLVTWAGFTIKKTIVYPINNFINQEINNQFGSIQELESTGKNLLCLAIRN